MPDGGPLAVWEFPQTEEGLRHRGRCQPKGWSTATTRAAYVHRRHRTDAWWPCTTPTSIADLFGSDILYEMGEWYNTALIGVESNNHGLTTLKALQDTEYRNIYRQHRHAQRFEPKTELLGWRTTLASKALAIDELGKEIREATILIPDAETIAELKTFVREGNGRMHGSPFDDRTMALAIAVQMLKHAWLPEYRVDRDAGAGDDGLLRAADVPRRAR